MVKPRGNLTDQLLQWQNAWKHWVGLLLLVNLVLHLGAPVALRLGKTPKTNQRKATSGGPAKDGWEPLELAVVTCVFFPSP